jgi:hypothetical protein
VNRLGCEGNDRGLLYSTLEQGLPSIDLILLRIFNATKVKFSQQLPPPVTIKENNIEMLQ